MTSTTLEMIARFVASHGNTAVVHPRGFAIAVGIYSNAAGEIHEETAELRTLQQARIWLGY